MFKWDKRSLWFQNFPVVSGNVSFYNGTNNKNIYPTPVIGEWGLIKSLNKQIDHNFQNENNLLILIGKTFGHLKQSCFLKKIIQLLKVNHLK